MKRPTLLVLVSLSCLPLFGCDAIRERLAGKAKEKAVETTTGGDVKISSGTSGVGTGALPAGWPASVPQYPGSKVASSMGTPQGKTAILETTDAPSAVASFYKSALSGMKLQADVDMGSNKVLTFNKGPQNVSITVSPSGAKNRITLSVAGF
jgi:hypothetical protein